MIFEKAPKKVRLFAGQHGGDADDRSELRPRSEGLPKVWISIISNMNVHREGIAAVILSFPTIINKNLKGVNNPLFFENSTYRKFYCNT